MAAVLAVDHVSRARADIYDERDLGVGKLGLQGNSAAAKLQHAPDTMRLQKGVDSAYRLTFGSTFMMRVEGRVPEQFFSAEARNDRMVNRISSIGHLCPLKDCSDFYSVHPQIWEKVKIESPMGYTGQIRYGDRVVLKAENGAFVRTDSNSAAPEVLTILSAHSNNDRTYANHGDTMSFVNGVGKQLSQSGITSFIASCLSMCEKPKTDCIVGVWGQYNTCSAKCGGGTYSRVRAILMNPHGGGKPCPKLIGMQSCNTHSCIAAKAFAKANNPTMECHSEHVKCHYNAHSHNSHAVTVTHGKHHQWVMGQFTCGHTQAKKAFVSIKKVTYHSPCARVSHYLGGSCTNIKKFIPGWGHKFGFKLTSRTGLSFDGKSFDASKMTGTSNVVKNVCLLALDGNRGKYKYVPDSFSFASNAGGAPMSYWYGNCAEGSNACATCMNRAVLKSGQSFSFSVGNKCSGTPVHAKAWTSVSCYWDTSAPFALSGAEELKTAAEKAKCVCKCNKHACCSKKGYTLLNPPLPGNVYKKSFTMKSLNDCCRACTEHPKCGSWTWGGGQHASCTLYSGRPIYKTYKAWRGLEPWVQILYAGARAGSEKCW